MSRRSSKKKANLKHIYILLFVVGVLGAGYYYIEKTEKETPQNYIPAPLTGEVGSPQYTLVENSDSANYEASVIYNENIGINDVAETFYQNSAFWPYIYLENKDQITNPLNIPKGIVLKIPRLSAKSINIKDDKSINRAKQLADSILSKSTGEVY
ncbi:LysM peptidoglycan-binding domain-containing protein [Dysgonomonas macrotermitis]|uniref:LysM domain-containing protein n=1 Tax=Dysgonomonas macrotermitis TaxID=1346286 RepID=A0A1M4ZIZ0_9BACT|nr:hypothetical protein [Dysgonomonas macrotermitis]SHF17767.1 hypothetical protein SAMN05444362_10497 [Dysgonomonas macrotermitis]